MSESAALFLAAGNTHSRLPGNDRFFYSTLQRLFIIVLVGALSVSCSDEKDTISSIVTSREGTGKIVHVDFDGYQGILEYTHHLGSTPQDLYFIFTNTDFSDAYGTTSFSVKTTSPSISSPDFSSTAKQILSQQSQNMRLKDRPELLDLSSALISDLEGDSHISVSSRTVQSLTVGVSTNDFLNWNFSTRQTETIPSILQHQIKDLSADVTLNIWVANDVWEGAGGTCLPQSKKHCLTKTMLEAFGEKFLKPDSSEDIYNWMTALYGAPWGEHSNPAYIEENAAKAIEILYYDIEDDNSPENGVVGYFWSKDNATYNVNDQLNYRHISNERLMFYIDAVMAANPGDDSTWDISDEMPAEVVSTLAHEFQHMIHFYQKTLLRSGRQSETWLNEMCSLVAEDLIADKIEANGPRGVAYDNYTAGSAGNGEGRLPWYNNQNFHGLIDWYRSIDKVGYSYATSYAFGSYLARNFGGAELFQDILQNNHYDYRAVISGLASQGVQLSFSELLRRWGVAVLLSDDPAALSGYRYNTGAGFDSSTDGGSFMLGSINLFNYLPTPRITQLSSGTQAHLYKTSNRYYQVGSGLTGSLTWTIEMPPGVQLTVVAKDSI